MGELLGVALFPDPDLSLHAEILEPLLKEKVVGSDASNHNEHPDICVGANIGIDDRVLLISLFYADNEMKKISRK